jgi:hypothetical protein
VLTPSAPISARDKPSDRLTLLVSLDHDTRATLQNADEVPKPRFSKVRATTPASKNVK